MSGWGCPHDDKGICTRLGGLTCRPGRKGCVLHGRFRFSTDDEEKAEGQHPEQPEKSDPKPSK